ncbi:hypothetical protein EP7_004992 [Isosphaeraceae bacterium EP7]
MPPCACIRTALAALCLALLPSWAYGQGHGFHDSKTTGTDPYPLPLGLAGVDLNRQSDVALASKSNGCVSCHQGSHDPHLKATVRLGCTDCHGGNASTVNVNEAHPISRMPEAWRNGSGNPVRSYTLLNHESPEYIRFVNPGDLRVAHISCGTSGCHPNEVMQNRKSMMTHGAMLWEAALYNNGSFPKKRAQFGESYSMNGVPQRIQTVPPPTQDEIDRKGVLPYLDPLPQFEITQPGNVLRIFERGGRGRPETGIPDIFEDPGRPRVRLSNRGLGTLNRTDPVFIGLQKTRLLDPTLNFLGTNDHAGDYRSSGCTACHVMYANDRSPVHSSESYYRFGNKGTSFSTDPMIPKNQPGHPIEHKFITAPPTSQCLTCHIHPGTTVMNSYVGYMWWDNETDGELMYPKKAKDPTAEEIVRAAMSNPDEASARGLWSDPKFLENITSLNPYLKHTQFADFHGHGWVYRSVFKQDRKGQLLDSKGAVIDDVTTAKLMAAMLPPTKQEVEHGKDETRPDIPLHMMDIHMEKGMHCVDCHFQVSAHGNGKLYGEVRNAIEIGCKDCHGTASERPNLKSSGPASPEGGMDLASLRTPFGRRRFERRGDEIIQNSMVEKDRSWRVVQTVDSVSPGHVDYNAKSHLAKTVRFDLNSPENRLIWGDRPRSVDGLGDASQCAHRDEQMSCISCHSGWNPSCYGCHLPQKANMKMPDLHNSGDVSRNYVNYNFQTLRDDVYMLARDGDVTGNRIGPARSSCAIHVGSYNGNRESIYVQQQTISAEGFSGLSFSTNVPHTVRDAGAHETKMCTDCHVSGKNDNNAIMAQLLMQGTNYLNFIGRYAWVASGEHGLLAVEATERDEPQAVFGSHLHKLAFPDRYAKHVEEGRELHEAHRHRGSDVAQALLHPLQKAEVLSVQMRGEYAYAACGEGGLRIFDVAFIDNKGFSERTTTAPVSPLGQKFFVKTMYATAVAAPSTLVPDPTRTHLPENKEGRVHPMYGSIYVADKYEGLIIVGAATLLDGNPLNNFLKRDVTFNPDDILKGARGLTIVGTYAYISCDAGLVVVSIDDPSKPRVTSVVPLNHAKAVAVQFRYAFACDAEGVKVLDVTDLAHPRPVASLPLADARSVYVARTRAYVSAGKQGLVILDVENPERPFIEQVYDAAGAINDLNDVKLGITYVSVFAYLADGKNGLRIVQLTGPETPGNDGFTPRPTPQLVATYKMPRGGNALAVSKGMDRDRAVDESGNQLAVFGRVGARPLSGEEQRRMYLRNGKVWTVSDDPTDPIYRRITPPSEASSARPKP